MDGLAKGSVTTFTEVFKLDSTLYRSQQTSTTYTGVSQTALGIILLRQNLFRRPWWRVWEDF